MINADFKTYDYLLYGTLDEYRQPTYSTEVKGTLKAAIYPITTELAENIKYKEATYILISKDNHLTDKFIILFNNTKLKVMKKSTTKRYTVAYCQEI